MITPRIAAVGTLALLILIIIVQNTEVVSVRLLFWELSMSLVILILLSTLAGFFSGYLVARIRHHRPRETP